MRLVTYQQLIAYFKTREIAADECGVSRQLLYHWEKHGIPPGRQALIQIQTRGRLRADNQRTVPK